MNLQILIDTLITDTLDVSLPRYLPELILCASMVVMLLARIVCGPAKNLSFYLALLGSVAALAMALPQNGMLSWEQMEPCELFTGMLVFDSLYLYLRIFLLVFLVLFVILSRLTGIADKREGQDYYTLVFGATFGMCIMASANHLIIVFLGIEMASVPSYVLAGIVQGRQRSSEASLKYAIYGAGTAGVMLYGISLLSGVLGSAHLPTMAERLSGINWVASAQDLGETQNSPESPTERSDQANQDAVAIEQVNDSGRAAAHLLPTGTLPTGNLLAGASDSPQTDLPDENNPPLTLMVLALGGLMFGVGLAFKLSAVPFHFWCPDVFEGASAEVDAFLSVASKAAAMTLLLRIGLGLGALPEPSSPLNEMPASAAIASQSGVETGKHHIVSLVSVADNQQSHAEDENISSEGVSQNSQAPLAPVRQFFVLLVAIVAALTCTFGNLAAYGQRNIKRMLAYSTIAHAGYMMMAVAAAVSLIGKDPLHMRVAIQSLLLYASIYLFMNLGAFSFVAFLRNAMGSEEIKDYAGLIRSCPWMTVAMVMILVSLVGLPPMAGFIGKFRIFEALFVAGGPLMMFLLVVAGINTVISLVYYLRVVKTLCIDPEPDTRGPVSLGFLPVAYTLLVSFPVILFGILPAWLVDWAYQATSQIFI